MIRDKIDTAKEWVRVMEESPGITLELLERVITEIETILVQNGYTIVEKVDEKTLEGLNPKG